MDKNFSPDLWKLSCCTVKACLQEKIFSVFQNLWSLFHYISITQQNEKVTLESSSSLSIPSIYLWGMSPVPNSKCYMAENVVNYGDHHLAPGSDNQNLYL